MRFVTHSHRFAAPIIQSDSLLAERYAQFTGAIEGITDEELVDDFLYRKSHPRARSRQESLAPRYIKSMSASINSLLRERVMEYPGWQSEVDIFNDEDSPERHTEWRLDFACDDAFCVEVAFNHAEAIPWNLLKPVLACELNHVRKAVQGRVGIYVCATEPMKRAGNFDGVVGSYEKVLRYLQPMMNQLTIPIMVIGLLPFETFRVSRSREIVYEFDGDIDRWLGEDVLITLSSYGPQPGVVAEYSEDEGWVRVAPRGGRGLGRKVAIEDIRFIEPRPR